MSYDSSSRLDRLTRNNGVVTDFDFDESGNRTQIDQVRSLANLNQNLNYGYDNRNQLISATNPIVGEANESFNYDDLGNRIGNITGPGNRLLSDSNFD